MNILLAVGLLTGVYMVDFEHPVWSSQQARVSYVEKDSPAARAGILPGDLITRIGNVQNPTWEDVSIQAMLSTREPVSLAVDRNGQAVTPYALNFPDAVRSAL